MVEISPQFFLVEHASSEFFGYIFCEEVFEEVFGNMFQVCWSFFRCVPFCFL